MIDYATTDALDDADRSQFAILKLKLEVAQKDLELFAGRVAIKYRAIDGLQLSLDGKIVRTPIPDPLPEPGP